jgi:pilus assembly protein CpaC
LAIDQVVDETETKNTRAISQVPWIGSVPVLGALFRSSDYQQQETDLVVS